MSTSMWPLSNKCKDTYTFVNSKDMFAVCRTSLSNCAVYAAGIKPYSSSKNSSLRILYALYRSPYIDQCDGIYCKIWQKL